MTIPDYQTLMRPFLAVVSDGKERKVRDVVGKLADEFQLTPEERSQTILSGGQSLFSNRANWACTYLAKAGTIKRTRRGHVQITQRGKKLLIDHPYSIDGKALREFPEFIAFQETKPSPATSDSTPSTEAASVQITARTPDDAIDAAFAEIQSRLETELLDRIIEKSPAFFESLVVDLIVEMGYGGSRDNVMQRIGKPGDQGIDGIVNEDALGLDVVYIQAKKFKRDASIGRDAVQSFAGALDGKRATKGIFVATCPFTAGAKSFADSVSKRIILIDGQQLVRLLIRYGVGVRVERDIQIKRIDLDYFDQDEE